MTDIRDHVNRRRMYHFPIVINCNYTSIWFRFRDKSLGWK